MHSAVTVGVHLKAVSTPLKIGQMEIKNINGRLIPTAEVTSLREQTTKARITEIYLVFKKKKFFWLTVLTFNSSPLSDPICGSSRMSAVCLNIMI